MIVMTKTTKEKISSTVASQNRQWSSYNLEELQDMIKNFASWLEKSGYASYDPYDIWGTHYGQWARRLYYKKNPMGAVLVAPVLLMEMICPSLRKFFVRKERFATADAQLVLSFLNLHNEEQLSNRNCQQATVWLTKAKYLAEELLSYSISGFSGYCWGYPFDWQHGQGLTRKGTPLITATPYCFEAFLGLFDVTGEDRWLEISRSIANFIFKDINDTSVGKNAAAGSYHPYDHQGKVINASAYRAFVLFEAAHRFGEEAFADKARKNLNFILQTQRNDGSWLYALDNPKEAFIDHFHTCFVLKNLHKINLLLNDPSVRQAIEDGYAYYRRELFDREGLPKSFAIQPRMQIVQIEMYNIAEAINLGALLQEYIPEAFDKAHKLACIVKNRFQLPEGYFITRSYIGGLKHKVPFLRWPQAQLFHALTKLLFVSKQALNEDII